jgi:hypothetical protein
MHNNLAMFLKFWSKCGYPIANIIISVVFVYPVSAGGPPFHPSVPSSLPSSVHPSKFLIPEEEDDGRV